MAIEDFKHACFCDCCCQRPSRDKQAREDCTCKRWAPEVLSDAIAHLTRVELALQAAGEPVMPVLTLRLYLRGLLVRALGSLGEAESSSAPPPSR